MSTINSVTIPGLAGLGSISAQAAYGIISKKSQTLELAQVAKAPMIKREQDYFEKTIKTVKTVDDFMKDPRLVNYVLTAYGLQSEADKTGILKKVFTQDPTAKTSLVNQLADTRFSAMATDLDFFNSGLAKLKGTTENDNFNLQTIGNRYVEVQSQTSIGDPVKTLFTNNAAVSVGADGMLETSDKYFVMGMKLDNRGQIQAPGDPTTGYQTADIKKVQVNWFDNKSTPTKTLTPHLMLDSAQPVSPTNDFTAAQVIKNPDGNDQVVQVELKQEITFSQGHISKQWRFTAKDSSGNTLTSETHALTFDANGDVSTVDGNNTTSLSSSLTWPSGTTTQSFDLKTLVHHADFTEATSVTDQTGNSRNVNLEYTKVDADTNRWQVKVYATDTGTLAKTLDVDFNTDGSVKTVGTYNADTGKIEIPDGDTFNTASVALDWQRGFGASTLKLDFSDTKSFAGGNYDLKKVSNDSIALGARTSVDIDKNGVVSATYNKADGSGTTKINLYQLSVATFDSPAGLTKTNGKDGYFTDTGGAGNVTYRPTGTGDGRGGTLAADAKNATTTSFIQTLQAKYDQNQYESALGDQNEALRYAVYFKEHAKDVTSMYGLMADTALRDVVSTVFQFPANMVNQPIETQNAAFTRRLDIKKLQDPTFVDQFIKRFLAISDSSTGSGGANGYQVNLLNGSASASNLLSILA